MPTPQVTSSAFRCLYNVFARQVDQIFVCLRDSETYGLSCVTSVHEPMLQQAQRIPVSAEFNAFIVAKLDADNPAYTATTGAYHFISFVSWS